VAKTITLKLKKGVKFTDGTDFNAAAVKWNLEAFTAADRGELAKIKSYDVVDDYTLRCNLSEWDNTVLFALATSACGLIVSPTAWKNAPGATTDKERNGWAENNPVGTGPFTLVSWAKGTKQVYKKSPNYWGKGMPYLDGLEWNVIADPMTLMAAFQAKEVDVLFGISPTIANNLKKAGLTVYGPKSAGGAAFKALVPNSAKADSPFKNVNLRQALGYAIDSKSLVDAIYSGYATPLDQYAVSGAQYANPDVKGYPFDLTKAQALMTAAGYSASNPLKVSITTENNPDDVNTCTAVQAMLAKAYFNVSVNPVERGLMMQNTAAGTWESILLGTFKLDSEPTLQFVRSVSNVAPTYGKGLQHFDDVESAIKDATAAGTSDALKKAVYQTQLLVFDKYAIFKPLFVISPLSARHPYAMDDNLMTKRYEFWTPESAWLNK
jgi:peptide/nickel transport system substrate-binding protein